jgi:hypothetical protein
MMIYNRDFNLTSAVSDALLFTGWALGPGGVPAENLRLLLSPLEVGVTGLPYSDAGRPAQGGAGV